MDRSEALSRFATAPVARLATVGVRGPHIVPTTFAFDGDAVVTCVDAKPKTTTRLQRLANIAVNPQVSLLADHYEDDWTRLWWVRVDGTARVVDSGHDFERALATLVARYEHYRIAAPPGPAIVIAIDRVVSWEAAGTAQ